jgi:hypothetical protein
MREENRQRCETVDDLARREAACCPFLDYRVETIGGQVVWTISDPCSDEHVAPVLDEFYALADRDGKRA